MISYLPPRGSPLRFEHSSASTSRVWWILVLRCMYLQSCLNLYLTNQGHFEHCLGHGNGWLMILHLQFMILFRGTWSHHWRFRWWRDCSFATAWWTLPEVLCSWVQSAFTITSYVVIIIPLLVQVKMGGSCGMLLLYVEILFLTENLWAKFYIVHKKNFFFGISVCLKKALYLYV
jgi:hypothetical protein